MKREELISLIDKVTAGKGILRTTGYWMRRLFKAVLGYSDAKAEEVKTYTDDAVKNVKVVVDSEMSDSSENAVSNKVIKAYVDGAVKPIGDSVKELQQVIADNEEVIAKAMNDLNARLDDIMQRLENTD